MDFLQRLAHILDQPFIPWKRLIVGFSIAQYLFESYLSLRQYRVLQAKRPPKSLEGIVSQEDYDKSQAYGRAKAKFNAFNNLYSQAQTLGVFYFDVLPNLWDFARILQARHVPARFAGEIPQSLLFFLAYNFLSTILSIPTSWYSTFVLEEKFGFNKQTPKIFITDLLKHQILTIALGSPILCGFLKIIQVTGNSFFYYLWLFSVVVQIFAITIYPVLILPLFNKLSPLEEGKLKTRVEALARKLKFPLNHLYVIDGSKRSSHSNAYFYGLPWKKHIVIYDTLIEENETEEVVAVLAHELGHWSLSHTTKLLGISQLHTFYIFALFSVFINNRTLYRAFGFPGEMPIIIGFLLFSDALAPMDTVVKLLMNILSRKYEFEADAFAVKLGYSTELAKSLIKLQIQNLATMDADWVYASYHYSHPILPERLGALGWYGEKNKELRQQIKAHKEKGKEEATVLKAGDREL